MHKRVVVPTLLAVGVWAGTMAVGLVGAPLLRHQVDALSRGAPAFLMPALPLGWAVSPAVFLAVRLCALRGGSHRECWAVGLAPLALVTVAYGVLLAKIGPSSLPAAAGITTGVLQGKVTLGSIIAARSYVSGLLSSAATCVAATWLCLFMMSERGRGRACAPEMPAPESA